MFSGLLNRELNENTVQPCYFLYGEETYLPEQFIRELETLFTSPEAGEFHLHRYYLDETRWADIIDTARTVAFLFSPWRIIVVRIPEKAAESEKDNGKGKKNTMTSVEEDFVRDYLGSPTPRTVMVVLYPFKVKKGFPLVRFFSSFPPSVVFSRECRPLKEYDVLPWINKRAAALGKTLTAEAAKRLMEIAGLDLQNLRHEVEKIALYTGDRKTIDVNDVDEISGWIKSFDDWEMANALTVADYEGCVVVLDKLFKNGFRPEQILGNIANFLRDIVMGKTWLAEKKERREIFAAMFPQVSEKFQSLYARKNEQYFGLVQGFSYTDLGQMLDGLTEVDRMIKSTDVSAQTALEGFLFDYCRRRKKAGR